MDFHRAWKSFLTENIDLELQLLIESKFKDAKAKYSELAERGLIGDLKNLITDRLGPRAVAKYIMWAAKQLELQRTRENDAVPFLSNQTLVIADAIAFFENNQKRMPQNDINKYKNLSDLLTDIRTLEPSGRQQRKKEKETAIEGSEVVYDDNDIFAVRPYTEGASCYYGKNTRWCISSTESENYFNQYTSENKAFVLARFENIPEDHVLRRLALVYDQDGYLDEVYDANDDDHDRDAIMEAVLKNSGMKRRGSSIPELQQLGEIVDELIDAGSANVEHNPPDATAGFEAKAEEIEEKYRDTIKHAYYHYDVDEYFYFSGGFEVPLDPDRVGDGEYELPSYFRDRDLEGLLAEEGFYAEEIDIGEIDGQSFIQVRLSTDNWESTPDGYEGFLDELESLDDNFTKMKRVVEKYLTAEGYMSPSPFDASEQEFMDLATSLSNFEMRDYRDLSDERIVFTNKDPIPAALPAGAGVSRKLGLSIGGNPWEKEDRGHGEEELHSRVTKRLQGLNKNLMMLLQKQLELPIRDLPPRIIEELSIPENLVISLVQTGMDMYVRIAFSLEPEVTRDVIDASIVTVKFMDKHFDSIVQVTNDVLSEMWEEHQAKEAAALKLKDKLDREGTIPGSFGDPQPAQESMLSEDIDNYFNGVTEEKGRSRQRGIYKLYCMLGYTIDTGEYQRGLDDILADVRALSNVTIVTVVIGNRRIAQNTYIAGLSIKFIPSIPGTFANPESVKSTIIRGVKKVKNVQRIFKVSSSLERVE